MCEKIHNCGDAVIMKFDNLVRNDHCIAGETIPVKVLVYPCQFSALKLISKKACEAGDLFLLRLRR